MSARVATARSALFHPWFAQQRVTFARRWFDGGARGFAALGLAGMGVALACLAGLGPARLCAWVLHPFAQWPLAAALVLALLVGLPLARWLSSLSQEMHEGWCAALPIAPRRHGAVLVAMAALPVLAGLVLALLAVALATFDVTRSAQHGTALASLLGGLLAASAVALGQALRARNAPPRPAAHAGRREPLFPLARLDDPRFPHLAQWQRRATVLRWRQGRGGHFWLIGAILILFPDRMGLQLAAGALLLVVSWLWLNLALRTCATVSVDALQMLRTLPVQRRELRLATLRYPAFASLCALALGACGAAMLGASWTLVLVWIGAMAVSCLPAAWRWHARYSNDGATDAAH